MTELTAELLCRMLHESSGMPEQARPEDVLDVAFDALGYDSLALLESIGLIERTFATRMPDDILGHATTPRELLILANSRLSSAA